MSEKCMCYKCQKEIKDRQGICFCIADLKGTNIDYFPLEDWERVSFNYRVEFALCSSREHIFDINLCYDCALDFLKKTFSEDVAKIIKDDFGIKEKGESE